jgi:hypothetical protein
MIDEKRGNNGRRYMNDDPGPGAFPEIDPDPPWVG